MRILCFIPSLDYSGAAQQLLLLAAGLPRAEFTLRVCILGSTTPWVETLHAAGIEVEVLGRKRVFDLHPWRGLRRVLDDFRPDVLHVWGLSALWPGLLLQRWSGGRLLFSALRVPHAARLPRIDRVLFGRQDCRLVARCPAESQRWVQLGLPAERIVSIAPGVARPEPARETGPDLRRRLGLEADARLLVGIGPLEPHKGFHDAIWAFDLLKTVYRDIRLVLVGDGVERPRLERFIQATGVAREVFLVGRQPDVTPFLHEAVMVWTPAQAPRGAQATLEAMAVGKPVVAAHSLLLAAIIGDGETGLLFPPGDKALFARQTRILLDDPELRRRFGNEGRKRAETSFTVDRMIQEYRRLYTGGG
jgi:glycosyltransferase involved in cell wall biosynthesis